MHVHHLVIPHELGGERLDVALVALLAQLCPGTTRSAARRLFDDGRVTIGHGRARPSRLAVPGETLTLDLPEEAPAALVASHGPLQVVYKDDDLLVIDKPAGLTVHPGAGHSADTLVHRLLGYDPGFAASGAPGRPGIVHRLDKDTSGLIVVARTPIAHAALTRQWQDRRVVKQYWALVEGTPREPEGAITMPIGRDPRNRKRMAPLFEGRSARTTYRLAEQYRGFSFLDVRIETGRTHQIRVHLAALGHPVAGDRLYGARRLFPGLDRQFLHAHLLGFILPSSGEYREFTVPLPPDLAAVLEGMDMER